MVLTQGIIRMVKLTERQHGKKAAEELIMTGIAALSGVAIAVMGRPRALHMLAAQRAVAKIP